MACCLHSCVGESIWVQGYFTRCCSTANWMGLYLIHPRRKIMSWLVCLPIRMSTRREEIFQSVSALPAPKICSVSFASAELKLTVAQIIEVGYTGDGQFFMFSLSDSIWAGFLHYVLMLHTQRPLSVNETRQERGVFGTCWAVASRFFEAEEEQGRFGAFCIKIVH